MGHGILAEAEKLVAICLTGGGWGHIVGARWSEPRARATFPRSSIEERTPHLGTLREVREFRDEDRASNVLPRAAHQRESPGGHHYVETDSGPACDCVGSDFGTGGSSADGTDADGVHVCKPVQCSAGKLGVVLGGYREDGRSHFGEADGERDDHRLVHV